MSTLAASPPRAQPDFFSFDDYDNVIGFVISQAADVLAKRLEQLLQENGASLTPREFVVLNRLHQYGELTQTQLSELSYKDPPATSRMVESLRRKNLVRRRTSKIDRRITEVSLTESGRALRNLIAPLLSQLLKDAVGDEGA
jgi:DNA-binding MarR family transcriptional regulator